VKPTIACILADHGVITSTEHPRLRSAMARLKRAGVLDNPLPGTFVLAADASERAWLRAVCAWSAPLGVLHTTTAASLWLPSLAGQTAVLSHPTLKSRRHINVTRRGVPGNFVRMADGLRFATPAYAAVELAATDDGRAVCEALRRRLANPAELREAMNGSVGQAVRRCVVEACLTNPWSYAELRLHRILREAGITGWVANRRLRLSGVVVHPDVLFPGARVVIEFDGRAVHDDPAQFLKDRERQNVLVAHGYVVLRFGWEHLDQPEYIVSMVRHALRTAGRIK
jgi:very-short-patch-repair endonuclease